MKPAGKHVPYLLSKPSTTCAVFVQTFANGLVFA